MKKKIVTLMLVVCSIALTAILTWSHATTIVPSVRTESLGYTGIVCKSVIRADGTSEDLSCSKNLMTGVGKNQTTRQLFYVGASASDIITTIQLGNTTSPKESDTALAGVIGECGLAEYTSLTWRNVSNSTHGHGNISSNYKWTTTCSGGVLVNNSGLVSADSDVYFAGNTFTDVTLQLNDELNVTWYVWIT